MNQKRRDIEIFAGFLPAIEICQIDWSNCSYYPEQHEENHLYQHQRPWSEYIRSYDEILSDGYAKLTNQTSPHFNIQYNPVPQPISTVQEETNLNNEEKSQDIDSGEESSGGVHPDQRSSSNSSDDCRIYFSDPQTSTKQHRPITTVTIIEPYVLKTLKSITDPLQVTRKEKRIIFELFFIFIRLNSYVVKHYAYMVTIMKYFTLLKN